MISKKRKYSVWLVYLLLAPILYSIVYHYSRRVESVFSIEFLLFAALGILVALFPIQTEKSILFLISGISVATLIILGLHAEMIVTSLAVITLMAKSDIKWDDHFRYPLNLLIFHVVSLVSAQTYYIIEALVGETNVYNISIIAVLAYLFANLMSNQVLIYLTNRYFYRRNDRVLFDEDFYFTLYTNFFIAPLSFILVYLYEELHLIGVVIGSLPFVTMTIGMNMFYKSRENNNYLRRVNLASQELAEKKSKNEVIDTYLHSLATIFPSKTLCYFSLKDDGNLVRERIYIEDGGVNFINEKVSRSDFFFIEQAINSSEIQCYTRAIDWKALNTMDYLKLSESALVLPVKRHNQVDGVILITHHIKNMYTNMLIALIEIFHQYFTIALDNANQYELLEEDAETDYLTGLPNLKGFAKKLERALNTSYFNTVSLIVLDLDHFKQTNDTYGHQAGNEVLKHMGNMLDSFTDDEISVARYGGEEFVILLPNYTKKEAEEYAEQVREQIEHHQFIISHSINSEKKETISVTASLGVATHPTDSVDPDELITLADRAMYIGSKQKGRNKVTVAQMRSYQYG
ncbi:hypothetical protein GCM10008932_13230 [Alkalibacterium iburiense]|uniref:GGDEF domain-containing protein n=1 Tax=Alkalibacterium iburiense TaxID=290589 RepID=A0ABN0XE64_9LACT